MFWQASLSAATTPCSSKSDAYEGTGTERRTIDLKCDLNSRFL